MANPNPKHGFGSDEIDPEREMAIHDAVNDAIAEAQDPCLPWEDTTEDNPNSEDGKAEVLDESKALAQVSATSLAPQATVSVQVFDTMIKDIEAKRELVMQYIRRNMVEGVDFGVAYDGSKKKVLLKPGAEKLHELLRCREEITLDRETMEIFKSAGKPVIAFICHAISKEGGQIMAEGRGACFLGSNGGEAEKKWQPNMLIKMSQKRASVDCAIRLASISSEFTQDMEQAEKPEVLPASTKPTYVPAPPVAIVPYKPTEEAAIKAKIEKSFSNTSTKSGKKPIGPFANKWKGKGEQYPITKGQIGAIWGIVCTMAKVLNFDTNDQQVKETLNDFVHWAFDVDSSKNMGFGPAKEFIGKYGQGQNQEELCRVFMEYKNL